MGSTGFDWDECDAVDADSVPVRQLILSGDLEPEPVSSGGEDGGDD